MLLIQSLLVSALAQPPTPVGDYTLSSPVSELEAASAASVERSLEPMNFAMAAIARPRLETLLTWCKGYSFSSTEQAFVLSCDDKADFKVPTTGPSGSYVNAKGERYPIDYRLVDGSPELTFHGDAGRQVTRYEFKPGGALQVHKAIYSKHLELPLKLVIDYTAAGS